MLGEVYACVIADKLGFLTTDYFMKIMNKHVLHNDQFRILFIRFKIAPNIYKYGPIGTHKGKNEFVLDKFV